MLFICVSLSFSLFRYPGPDCFRALRTATRHSFISEHKYKYFDEIWELSDPVQTATQIICSQTQKRSKDIDKTVHVTSVAQLQFCEATRILFVRKENKITSFIEQFFSPSYRLLPFWRVSRCMRALSPECNQRNQPCFHQTASWYAPKIY